MAGASSSRSIPQNQLEPAAARICGERSSGLRLRAARPGH
eukprot:SAG11_NODE_14370_length_614_cov_1.961165_1_plen_39_part_01